MFFWLVGVAVIIAATGLCYGIGRLTGFLLHKPVEDHPLYIVMGAIVITFMSFVGALIWAVPTLIGQLILK